MTCPQAARGGGAAVGGAAGADAAARAGLALLLAAPAPPARRLLAALELYPHADVIARVRYISFTFYIDHLICSFADILNLSPHYFRKI